ncbi:uncharacterized protein TrAFT101_007203 [Trichoderma asperellum]|uniref:uncharacterized protein n=1 Tax=Trichoderma asperellum TaxID=101201 RepID=UPI0033256AC5|nr:hypothetical protein TrAFT101_007203 [Trichoderma asperellum]
MENPRGDWGTKKARNRYKCNFTLQHYHSKFTCHLPTPSHSNGKVHKIRREKKKLKRILEYYLERRLGTDITGRVQSPSSERTLSQDESPFFGHFTNKHELYRHRAACSLGELASL